MRINRIIAVCVLAAVAWGASPANDVAAHLDRKGDHGKPSVGGPAAFVAIGALFTLAGGLTYGLIEDWGGYGYGGDFMTPGQMTGLALIAIGGVSLAAGTPVLALRIKRRKAYERRTPIGEGAMLRPHYSRTGQSTEVGLSLSGRF